MICASTKIKVRFAETDEMGVVYHANYLPWCECARLALIESFGVKYEDLIESGFHLPVVEVRVNYKYPARFDDEVEIKAKITQTPNVKIVIEYELTANSRLLATAQTTHVFVNSSGAPVKPPREFMDALKKAFDK